MVLSMANIGVFAEETETEHFFILAEENEAGAEKALTVSVGETVTVTAQGAGEDAALRYADEADAEILDMDYTTEGNVLTAELTGLAVTEEPVELLFVSGEYVNSVLVTVEGLDEEAVAAAKPKQELTVVSKSAKSVLGIMPLADNTLNVNQPCLSVSYTTYLGCDGTGSKGIKATSSVEYSNGKINLNAKNGANYAFWLWKFYCPKTTVTFTASHPMNLSFKYDATVVSGHSYLKIDNTELINTHKKDFNNVYSKTVSYELSAGSSVTVEIGGTDEHTTSDNGEESIKCTISNLSVSLIHNTSTSTNWSYTDGTTHIRTCTVPNCPGGAGSSQTADHNTDRNEVTQEPTCSAAGERTYYCTDCNGAVKTEPIAIVPESHDWGKWVSDGEKTHTRKCGYNNNAHIETENHAWGSTVIKKQATETEDGLAEYTCTDCGQTRSVTIPAGNKSDVSVRDAGSMIVERSIKGTVGSVKTNVEDITVHKDQMLTIKLSFGEFATYYPKRKYYVSQGKDLIQFPDSTIVNSWDTTEHGYGWGGEDIVLIADKAGEIILHLDNEGSSNKEHKDIKIHVESHDGSVEFSDWDANNKTCTATRTCSACGAVETMHLSLNKGVYEHVQTPATCTEKGTVIYTATAFDKSKDYSAELPAKNHSWNEPVFTFSTDGKSASAKRTCKNDSSHVEEVTNITATGVVTAQPTCTEKGTTTYTAKATFGGVEKSATKNIQDVPAKGHNFSGAAWYVTDGNYSTHYRDCVGYGAVACDNGAGKTDSHTADFNAPVFVWNGYTATASRTCKTCGIEQDLGSASVTSQVSKKASCTEDGIKVYTASVTVDGHTYTDAKNETLSQTGHSPATTWTNDPTTGKHYHACQNSCGEKLDLTAHTWNAGEVTTSATCEDTGVKTFTCTASGCGATYTETVSAAGHKKANTWSVDTNGNHYKECTVCHEHLDVAAHNYGTWTQGETQHSRTCSVCNHAESVNHNWGTVAFTWAESGKSATAKHTCATCGKEASTAATITSKEKTPATCTVKGWTTYTAAAYGATDAKDVQDVALKAHSGQKVEAVAPKCEEPGVKEYWTCTVCHKYFSNAACTTEITDLTAWKKGDGKVNPTGHAVGSLYKEQKSATCTEDGVAYNVYACANGCGKYLKDANTVVTAADWTAAKLGHNLTKTNQVDAKCGTAGTKAYWTCSTCPKVFSDSEGKNEVTNLDTWKVIPALEHNYSDYESCGSAEHTPVCSLCGDKKANEAHTAPADSTARWNWVMQDKSWNAEVTVVCTKCQQEETFTAAVSENGNTVTATAEAWGHTYSDSRKESAIKTQITVRDMPGQEEPVTTEHVYLTIKTVTAPAKKGSDSFIGWYEVKEAADGTLNYKLVSSRRSYTFFVTRSITLAPRYTNDPTTIKPEPTTEIEIVKVDSTTAKVTFKWSLPDGYELVQAGIQQGTKKSAGAVALDLIKQVKPNVSKVTKPNGTYILTLTGVPTGKYVNAVGYLDVKDANGNQLDRIYSDIVWVLVD